MQHHGVLKCTVHLWICFFFQHYYQSSFLLKFLDLYFGNIFNCKCQACSVVLKKIVILSTKNKTQFYLT